MSDIFAAFKKVAADVVSVIAKYARRRCKGPDDGSTCEGDGWCRFDKDVCERCEQYYNICGREGCNTQLGIHEQIYCIKSQNNPNFAKTFCQWCYDELRSGYDPDYPFPEYYDSDDGWSENETTDTEN